MDLQEQINELRREVADLKHQLISGGPRLGPGDVTRQLIDEDSMDQVKQRAALLKKNVQHEHETDRQGRLICTTKGDAPSEARAKQTNDTGMHESYIVLCEEERQKGFVRPYRDRYRHLTCGTETTMGRSLSETYARDPKFYSHTFCVYCNRHPPVAEFVWTADGLPVGS